MTAQLAPAPVFRSFDAFGFPLYLGQLGTFIAGTATPQATYVDSTLTTQNTNPIILNPRGECNLWLDPTKVYKFVLSDALGNLIWTVDNINGGSASPSFNIVPTVDNLFTLGTPAFSFANLYLGPNHAPVLGASGNVGYYKQTPAEFALSVTPTDYSYPAYPYVDPRRYGADPTGVVVSTAAVQTAINVAYQCKGVVWIGNQCNYLVGALSLTLTGNHTTDGLHIMGAAINGSRLTQSGNPSAILTLIGSTPTGNPQEAPILLENFTIFGNGNTADGIALTGIAQVIIRGVYIGFCNHAINGNSALIVTIQDGDLYQNNYGAYFRSDGAGSPPNLIRILNTGINDNAFYGVDYDTGSLLTMRNCDVEGNGTAATCTSNPAITATSATLTAPWPLASGVYACFFSDGETRSITFTNGSTAISWTGGLSATQSAAWIGTPTGAVHIGGGINAFPSFGFGQVALEDNWFEGNTGGWAVLVDAPNAGQITDISIKGGFITSSSNGNALKVSGATNLLLERLYSISPADVWNLTATRAALTNCDVSTLTDTGIVTPIYADVSTSSTVHTFGRVTSFVGTLTTAGGATGTILAIQQGKSVRLIFPTLDGGSTGTTATITGMPAAITPSTDRQLVAMLLDNNVQFIGGVTIGASGVITLTKPGGTFTAANSKGIQGGTVGPYDL